MNRKIILTSLVVLVGGVIYLASPCPLFAQSCISNIDIEVDESINFSAESEDSEGGGGGLSGYSYTYESSNSGVASVSDGGDGTASVTGVSEGTATITTTASKGGEEFESTVAVNVTEPAEPSAEHPNEPVGFTEITDNPFDEQTASGWTCFSCTNLSIVSDATAPESPSNVAAALFPAGFVGGGGPINTTSPTLDANEFYAHFTLKMSENWDGHSSNINKVFFFKTPSPNRSNVIVTAYGSGDESLQLAITPEATGWPTADTYHLFQSSGSSGALANEVSPPAGSSTIVRGEWVEIELHVIGGTPGNEDGEVHVWMDGVKTHQYTGIQLLQENATPEYANLQWNPTYGGGSADSVSADQYQYIDHVYISEN